MTDDTNPSEPATNRRRVLQLGAVAAATVVTVRPALAQTAGSVLTCEIPVPNPGQSYNYIAPDGSIVPPGTSGAFPPPGRALRGEEVKAAIRQGRGYSGYSYEQSQAYTNYIRRLQNGMSGFTCYASIQMQRR